MQQLAQAYRSEDHEHIPDSAGVYAFFYNPFQRGKLGLYLDKTPSSLDIKVAKKTLRMKLEKYAELKSALSLTGSIKEVGAFGGSYKQYAGRFSAENLWLPGLEIDSLDSGEFLAYLSMAERAFAMFQPLYCGMTVDQGLRTRWKQHQRDFNSEDTSSFGGRLRELNFAWTDLVFVCVPIAMPGENSDSIKKFERHLMYLCEPTLSIR